MRKNNDDSKRSPRTPSGSKPRSSGTGKRDGKPRVGGGFKPKTDRGPRGSFGERPEGSSEASERKPHFDRGTAGKKDFSAGRRSDQGSGMGRDSRRGSEQRTGGFRDSKSSESDTGRAGGFGEQRRSTDWSTGGYRIMKKGAGKGTGGFKGFGPGKDADQGAGQSRRPGRDSEDFRGPRREDGPRTEGFRGPRREDGPRTEGFRGPRREAGPRTEGFRGPRREAGPRTEGFRGPRREAGPRTEGFRGPRREDGPRTEGFRGPRREDGPRTEGFRGPRKEAGPKAGGFRDSKRGFENKGPRKPVNRNFNNQHPKEESFTKKEALTDDVVNEIEEKEDRVEGRNPVFEALRSGRPLNKLFVEKDSEDPMISRIVAMAREKDIPIQYLERFKLDTMSQTRVHQGAILEVAAQEYVEVEDILAKAAEKEEKPFVLVLDEITDTNNLGSIIRSAECSGVHGIVLPKRRSATLNATVAKVAAGALEYVPVARVGNLVQTLRQLKAEGLWIIGADMDGQSNYYDTDLKGPVALVIGSEGEGLSRLIKDECDLMVKIPLKGKISSLNAGVAAALIMFEISKQRG